MASFYSLCQFQAKRADFLYFSDYWSADVKNQWHVAAPDTQYMFMSKPLTYHTVMKSLDKINKAPFRNPNASQRNLAPAMIAGARKRCPACERGKLYTSFLKVVDNCPECREALHHQRADDAPPYFTILIVGHIIVSLLLIVELAYAPPLWLHFSIWMPLTVILALWILPRVKGALIALQWSFFMHGFDPDYEKPGGYGEQLGKWSD